MQFNSIDFPIFLIVVFAIYWSIPGRKIQTQNLFLLAASYFFYGWWDWRFLSLVAISSLTDFFIGIAFSKTEKPHRRKLLLYTSLTCNLGILAFFKYYNFFLDSLYAAFSIFGNPITESAHLNIILPLGISFYTFQTLSYTIDVYRGKIRPTHKLIDFLAYVSFFPQLVAGPIERAKHLLPQFQKQRSFDCDQAIDGLKQILWGLVKKLLIADACAPHVAEIFTNHQDYQGSTLLLGAILFAFQIYGDFSGYTDMAIGTARLFGFKLSKNFAYPYFSRDIAEFWRRWHISLTSWFKEYLYIPLGGSRCGTLLNVRNTFIVFIVSGLWHGANWTFIAWGAFNAMLFLPLLLTRKNKINQGTINQGSLIPSGKVFLQVGGTFFLTCIGWVFFRSETLTDAFQYLAGIASKSLFTLPEIRPRDLILTLGLFTLIEWTQREHEYALRNIRAIIRPRLLRFCIYSAILIKVTLNPGASSTFIYFQF